MAPHAEESELASNSQAFSLTVVPNGAITEKSKVANGDALISKAAQNNSTEEDKGTAAEGEPAKIKIREEDVGAISESRDIYRSKKDDNGEYTWVDKYPEDAPEAAENDETARYAIIVRKKKSSDSRKKLEAHSLIVQSPWLRKALSEILEDYPGVTCELKRLVFEAPFREFVHRWASFQKYRQCEDLDEKTIEHLDLLHSILQEEIGGQIKEFEDYVSNGVITFETLWMIFQPGCVVVANHQGPRSAFEFVDSEYIETQCGQFLRLSTQCVDWNGEAFGRCEEKILIPKFSGTKSITSLKAVPLSLEEDKEQLKLQLIARGKKFEALGGYCYKAYSGQAITWDQQMNEQSIYVTGRVVVDVDAFGRYTNYPYRYVENFHEKDLMMLAEFNDSLKDDEKPAVSEEDKYLTPMKKSTWSLKLSPYHLMLCRSRTRGYSLKLKKWLEFFVPLINDIDWSNNAFDNLVLPDDQKELVLSFAESQIMNRESFDDVIAGKGRGIIMLLAGPPGVGKTLTAEAVAEHMRCPLHSITSGDLGSHPREVEIGLSRTLDLVSRWNAILLIDECDVFLEARSVHDLERNKTVSIFLRTLEYFEGMLFMTTNRADNIDTAFQSRIHVSLEYPDLNDDARRQIWVNFMKASSRAHDLTDRDFEELAAVKINGRQIKNILKTAQLLAMRKNMKLNRKHIETVLSIEQRRYIST